MRILDIVPGTSVDGPGLRTAIYVAGCSHGCPGCHNPQSWNFGAGREMSIDEVMLEVIENDFDVTLTGGDPMYSAEQLIPLAARIKEAGKSIWCYSGFSYEAVMGNEPMRRLLEYVDVLVDGPYVEALRDPSLRFRGSSNQRLVDLRRSVPGELVFYDE